MLDKTKTKICIVGAGAFGTAMQQMLNREGYNPIVWELGKDMKEYLSNKDFLIFAIPSQAFREVFTKAKDFIGDAIVINLAKGIEINSLKRMSEVAFEVLPDCKYVALSGPSHAEEVATNLPTTVAIAAKDQNLLAVAQELLSSERFRVYSNEDLIGLELGGALKNVIAVATGVSDGLKFGDNTRAALMTRGLAEITRLASKMGANPLTFLGLAGVGDLIVTCGSMHSRNRRCGILIGEGLNPNEAQKLIGQVVEGVDTCKAVYKLSQKYEVEMPITEYLYKVLTNQISVNEGMNLLLARDTKAE